MLLLLESFQVDFASFVGAAALVWRVTLVVLELFRHRLSPLRSVRVGLAVHRVGVGGRNVAALARQIVDVGEDGLGCLAELSLHLRLRGR